VRDSHEAASLVTQPDLREVQLALRSDMRDLEQRLKSDIKDLRLDVQKDLAPMKADIVLLKWMMGVVVAGVLALVMKAFGHV
jgi:hypothetical protein